MSFLMGEVTAWTDNEAKAHGCRGGAAVKVDERRDGYTVRLCRAELVEVFIPHELVAAQDEAGIRAKVREGCELLAADTLAHLTEPK